MRSPILTQLILPPAYCAERSQVFPSKHSFQWFVRQHRNALLESGALLLIAGRWMVNPVDFDAYVLKSAARRASSMIAEEA